MGDSFTTARPLHLALADTGRSAKRRRVLVTGAAGNIGSYFAEHNHDRYTLRLAVFDEDQVKDVEELGEVVVVDVTDLEQTKRACAGIDVVLHLAADPSPEATWASLLPANIVGTYNVFAAAKAAGVKRVVYASSIHAVSGYPAEVQVQPDDPVNPGDLYGVSKCFGEALGRYMAEKEGVACIAVRIGAFQPLSAAREAGNMGMMDAYVSHRDLSALLQRCVEADHLQWAVVNGLSANRFNRLDITSARELLGYSPQDDFTELNPKLAKLNLSEQVQGHHIADPEESGLREDV